jgi:D-beta-D-heptose 7-phosphate kinase/D-beta-D-heptose 1-phosphate adenosyltransferase
MTKAARGKYKPSIVNPLNQRAMRILNGNASFNDRFFPKHNELVAVIKMLRSMGCVIAFTSGVWDLLHVGHSRYIQQGKDEACKLYPKAERVIMVVGIDTDAFTRSRKGPNRPLVSEDERSEMLFYQRAVDIIVPQYKADQLFRVIEHDVRVISVSTKDLPNQKMIKRFCRHLVNLPPQAEVSTTIRVRDIMLDGRREQIGNLKKGLLTLFEGFEDELKKV